MWFEILLVFILFKLKKCPNISRIWVVYINTHTYSIYLENIYMYLHVYIYIHTIYIIYKYI